MNSSLPETLPSSTPPSLASSTSSESSEATTPDPSSLAPAAPATSTPTARLESGGFPIQFDQKVLLTGDTRSGKSTLARSLYLSAARWAPGLIIDPQDSTLTTVPGHTTFRDPTKFPADARHARFVPREPDDLDAYDAVYRRAFRSYPRVVWTDEAGVALPVSGRKPPAGRTLIVQGAKRMILHIGCHTGPRELYRGLFRTAQHFFIFATPNPDDRRHLADVTGISGALFEQLHAELVEHGFLWFDRPGRRLVVCPPLPMRS